MAQNDPTSREGVSKLSRRGLMALGATFAGASGLTGLTGTASAHGLTAFRDAFIGNDEDKTGLGSKGWVFFAKDTGTLYFHNGSGWKDLGIESPFSDTDGDNLLETPNHNGIDTGTLQADSVDSSSMSVESASIKKQAGTHHWAAEYDGSTAEKRLDNALAAASVNDVVVLEGQYSNDRTITTSCTIRGTGVNNSTNARVRDNAVWTIDADDCTLERVRFDSGAELVVDGPRVNIRDVYEVGDGITINNDKCSIVGMMHGDVTFSSGTSRGLVDSCVGVSVTDNGSNTVGNIS